MHVLITCKYEKDRIKSNREKMETPFFPLYVNAVVGWGGDSVAMDTRVLIQSASKHYAAFSYPH